MNEEKKYTIVGKVEIGTDEYRDLIEGLADARNNASEERSKRWKLETDLSEFKKKNSEIEKSMNELKAFVQSDVDIFQKFAVWKANLRNDEE